MAVAATVVITKQNLFAATLTWADADITGTFNHALAGTPVIFFYTYTQSGAIATVPMVGVTVTATQYTVVKTTVVAGSGASAAGLFVAMLPHSAIG